jgi:hypothetical protein
MPNHGHFFDFWYGNISGAEKGKVKKLLRDLEIETWNAHGNAAPSISFLKNRSMTCHTCRKFP